MKNREPMGRARAFSVATGVLLAAGAVHGQPLTAAPPPTASPTELEARTAFETGVTALQDERYANALSAFQRSYGLRRTASVALNLGVTLRALGRLVEAGEHFREFLALASPSQHVRYDTEVTGYLSAVERQVGRIRVRSLSPAGASLRLDYHPVIPDVSGDIVADPGEHHLEAVAAGYATGVQTVRVSEGERVAVDLSLSRPDGWLVTRWWFWGGVGVVAAAAVVTGVILGSAPRDLPATNTGLVVQAVSR